jgi:hypothetical protein
MLVLAKADAVHDVLRAGIITSGTLSQCPLRGSRRATPPLFPAARRSLRVSEREADREKEREREREGREQTLFCEVLRVSV